MKFSTASETDYAGLVERGIIGESAIHMIWGLDVKQYNKLKLDDKLKDAFKVLGPSLDGLGPRILPIVMRPAASIGHDAFQKADAAYRNLKDGGTEASPDTTAKELYHPAISEGATDAKREAFLAKMWADTVEVSGEDWFFEKLGTVIYSAIINPRTPTKTAPDGLCFLSSLSSAKGSHFVLDDAETDFQALGLRAIFGEAAILALIQCDNDKLESYGCFDAIKRNAQGIGRQALKTAKWMLPLLEPVLVQLLKGQTNGQQNVASPATDLLIGNTNDSKSMSHSDPGSNIAKALKRATLSTRGLPVGSAGKSTVQQMLADRLQKTVNLDGAGFHYFLGASTLSTCVNRVKVDQVEVSTKEKKKQ